MRKIDAIDGVIDENKKEELKSEYPGFYLLNDLIKNHNKKFNKNDSKMNYSNENNIKKNYSGKNNIKKDYSKPFEEFKTKLKGINHIIYGDEITELNPKNFSYYNRLIKIHNTKLINNEKLKISKEFNSELKKYNTIIDEEEIEKLKAKYTKDYYDFFTEMDMEKSINNYNKNLEKKQMVEVFSILRQKYSSLNSPISEKIVSDLILKYPSMDWDN